MVGTSEAHAAIDAGLPLYRQYPWIHPRLVAPGVILAHPYQACPEITEILRPAVNSMKLADYDLAIPMSLPRAMAAWAIAAQAALMPARSGSERTERSA